MTSLLIDLDRDSICELAGRFGTPLYVYNGACFERQHRALSSCLPPGVELFYAVKANPLTGVLRLFRRAGCGAEVASEGELRLVLAAGYSPRDIVYTCPGKTRDGIALAIRRGVYSINVEAIDEAALIDSVADDHGKSVDVAVRLNPRIPNTGAALKMSGLPSQFGVDEEDFGNLTEELRMRLTRLNLIGVHVYSGTQVLDVGQLLCDAERILELGSRLSREHGFALRFVDLGGGFGFPYQETDAAIDLELLRRGYAELWRRYTERFASARVITESGRFLAADAGAFITRVTSTKVSRGTKFIICDGGYAHHPASAHIARMQQNRYPVVPLYPAGEPDKVTVVGPTGTPVDILARDIWLDRVKPGDLLVVGKSGAYGYTNSCQLFFSGPSPAEIMVHGGDVTVLRERGRFDDVQQRPE